MPSLERGVEELQPFSKHFLFGFLVGFQKVEGILYSCCISREGSAWRVTGLQGKMNQKTFICTSMMYVKEIDWTQEIENSITNGF